jgi:hypothetical protein
VKNVFDAYSTKAPLRRIVEFDRGYIGGGARTSRHRRKDKAMTKKPGIKTRNPPQARRTTRARARDTDAKKPAVVYSPELAERFCEALVTRESIADVCAQPGMPSESTVYLWIYRHPEFYPMYDRAWTAGCERMANELIGIVDDSSRDKIQRKNENTGRVETVTDHEHISRSRLRFDARRWLLSKRNRKAFGDQVDVGVSGSISHTPAADSMTDLETARSLIFTLSLGEDLLRNTGFPELAKLLGVEDALRAHGINPRAPFDRPVPPRELLALSAPAGMDVTPARPEASDPPAPEPETPEAKAARQQRETLEREEERAGWTEEAEFRRAKSFSTVRTMRQPGRR